MFCGSVQVDYQLLFVVVFFFSFTVLLGLAAEITGDEYTQDATWTCASSQVCFSSAATVCQTLQRLIISGAAPQVLNILRSLMASIR